MDFLTSKKKLLPCPHCGHSAELREDSVHGPHWGQWDRVVWCSSSHCRAEIRLADHVPDVEECLIRAWNRRASQPPTADRICDDELKITYEHGQPHGIRDRGGYLFFFSKISKYSGQEERYRDEVAQAYRLADFLLRSLQRVAVTKEPIRVEPHPECKKCERFTDQCVCTTDETPACRVYIPVSKDNSDCRTCGKPQEQCDARVGGWPPKSEDVSR